MVYHMRNIDCSAGSMVPPRLSIRQREGPSSRNEGSAPPTPVKSRGRFGKLVPHRAGKLMRHSPGIPNRVGHQYGVSSTYRKTAIAPKSPDAAAQSITKRSGQSNTASQQKRTSTRHTHSHIPAPGPGNLGVIVPVVVRF